MNQNELAQGQLWQLGRHLLWIGDALLFSEHREELQQYGDWRADLVLTDPPFSLAAEQVCAATIQFAENFIITGCGIEYHRLCTMNCYRYCFEIVSQRRIATIQSGEQEPQYLHWNNGFLTRGGDHCFDPMLTGGTFSSLQPFFPFEIETDFAKPLDWAISLLQACRAETVCDPFVGTGTVLLACEELNKQCFAIEILPQRCHTTLSRWHNATSQKPVRLI